MGLTHLVHDISTDKRQKDMLFRAEHMNLTITCGPFSPHPQALVRDARERRTTSVGRTATPQHHNLPRGDTLDQRTVFKLCAVKHRLSRSMSEENDNWIRHPGCSM